MKKLLLILLCAPLLFTSCSKDDDNSDSGNDPTGSGNSSDLFGVWHFQGPHDLSGEFMNDFYYDLNEQACALMSYLELNENGFGRFVSYSLENEISGPCNNINEIEFQWEQTNSTTLVFSNGDEPEDLILELVSSTQLQVLVEDYYVVWELFE